MPIPYLGNKTWADISRDERMFCAVLWEHARKDPADFAMWLNKAAGLSMDSAGSWDLGYEVVFYRDLLHHAAKSARIAKLPFKRTFDMCLFGERDIVIIEAKLSMGFLTKQLDSMEKDIENIRITMEMIHKKCPEVHVVALTPEAYRHKHMKNNNSATSAMLGERWISWEEVADKYPDELLRLALRIYKH